MNHIANRFLKMKSIIPVIQRVTAKPSGYSGIAMNFIRSGMVA
jgi:hypothetical protein